MVRDSTFKAWRPHPKEPGAPFRCIKTHLCLLKQMRNPQNFSVCWQSHFNICWQTAIDMSFLRNKSGVLSRGNPYCVSRCRNPCKSTATQQLTQAFWCYHRTNAQWQSNAYQGFVVPKKGKTLVSCSTKAECNIDCHWPQRHIIQDVNLTGPESPSMIHKTHKGPASTNTCSKCHYLQNLRVK